jgi:hypothetical protein
MEDYQLKITHSFTALENLKVDRMEISRAWENIRGSKDGKSPDEDNLNSQQHKYAGESFHERLLLVFNTIYIMGE